MSLRTWKDEFYPVPASEVTSRCEAIVHSRRKWEGLRPENLAKHGVELWDHYVHDAGASADFSDALSIDADTCALCHLFYVEGYENCETCPIVEFQGHRCDRGPDSQYRTFRHEGDPSPMIRLLNVIS